MPRRTDQLIHNINELYNTEKTYQKGLRTLAATKAIQKNKQALDSINKMLSLSEKLLERLEDGCSKSLDGNIFKINGMLPIKNIHETATKIGEFFQDHEPTFATYGSYVALFDDLSTTIAKAPPMTERITLEALLITPIQRPTRYKLLLQEMSKNAPKVTDTHTSSVKNAIAKGLESTLHSLNDMNNIPFQAAKNIVEMTLSDPLLQKKLKLKNKDIQHMRTLLHTLDTVSKAKNDSKKLPYIQLKIKETKESLRKEAANILASAEAKMSRANTSFLKRLLSNFRTHKGISQILKHGAQFKQPLKKPLHSEKPKQSAPSHTQTHAHKHRSLPQHAMPVSLESPTLLVSHKHHSKHHAIAVSTALAAKTHKHHGIADITDKKHHKAPDPRRASEQKRHSMPAVHGGSEKKAPRPQ